MWFFWERHTIHKYAPWLEMNEEQLRAAAIADPTASGPHQGLGLLYLRQACGALDQSRRIVKAKNAVKEYQLVYALEPEATREYQLQYLAWAAYRAGELTSASRYAASMLACKTVDWNLGNNIFHGHTILGLLALNRGDVRTAKSELLLSGKTPGSPQLMSFGPNMSLADGLVRSGEGGTVIAYLELCRKFWKMDFGHLSKWEATIRQGYWPNFSPNLTFY